MLSAINSTNNNSSSTNSILNKFPVFKDLNDLDLESIWPYFIKTQYNKDTVIFYEQDIPFKSGSLVYFVLNGYVKLVKYSSDGESTIMRVVSPGEFFGMLGALTKQPFPFSAEAMTDTTVFYMTGENFRKIITQFPSVALNMMCTLGELLWFSYATHNQVIKKSDTRVAKIILYYLERNGYEETPQGLQLKTILPHEYIASLTGIAYEESVRIISRLKKNYNCIKYIRGGKIIITDPDQLRTAAQNGS